jgi:hypothetical protein
MMTFQDTQEQVFAFDALSNAEQETVVSIERGRPDPEDDRMAVELADEVAGDYAEMLSQRETEESFRTYWYY